MQTGEYYYRVMAFATHMIATLKVTQNAILTHSRTTTGAFIANRVTDKLTQVHDKIWCCRSGSAADTQAVADIVTYHLQSYAAQNDKDPSTKVAASMFQELCYNNKDNLTAGIIVAGYDDKNGGEVYSIPLGGSLHKQDYAIAGSGSTYIYGLCQKNFKQDMTKEECVLFIKNCEYFPPG